MDLIGLLCKLQIFCFTVKGLDLPLKPNQKVRYTKHDTLQFLLSFTNFPKVPNHQTFSSVLYLKNTKDRPEIISGPIKHHLKIGNHFFIKRLDDDDDGTIIYVQIHNDDDDTVYYEENILTLFYVKEILAPNKSQCLDNCRISMDEWIPKRNPHNRLMFNGRIPSNMTSYVSVREKVIITCKGYNMPLNTHTVLYKNNKKYKDENNDIIKGTIDINEGDTTTTIYCISYYNDSQFVKSKTYTLLLKAESKPHKISLITEPELNNVTYYQVGDRFAYNCTASENSERITFYWFKKKDGELSNSTSFAVIDIVLNESYDHTVIECNATYLDESLEHFYDISVTTTLILNSYHKILTPWWWCIIAILVIIIIAALTTVVYCHRKRNPQNDDYEVNVQNDLYGQDCAMGVVYAQLYDHRNGAPPPPPPLNRVHYSNVIGYLKENN